MNDPEGDPPPPSNGLKTRIRNEPYDSYNAYPNGEYAP